MIASKMFTFEIFRFWAHRCIAFALVANILFFIGCVEPLLFTSSPPSVPVLRLPMNDAYLGSAARSSSLQPHFVWEESTADAAGDIRYELDLSLDPTFERELISVRTFETSYTQERNLPISTSPPVGARYFWRVRACLRSSCSDYSKRYVNVGRVAKDYNGDGYSDLAIGAPLGNDEGSNSGIVYIYLGSSTGSSYMAWSETLYGDSAQFPALGYGHAISAAGDVNGDGFSDLLISTWSDSLRTAGMSYLHLGGMSKSEVQQSQFSSYFALAHGNNVLGPGDLNGDGYSDMVILREDRLDEISYVQVYWGTPTGAIDVKPNAVIPVSKSDTVNIGGDINGDGFADLIIGSPETTTPDGALAGAAYIYHGAPGTAFDTNADAELRSHSGYQFFGHAVASAGDLDLDGFSDIIVGVGRTDSNGDLLPGRAYVYFGDKTSSAWVADLLLEDRISFSSRMTSAGDVNGDGFADLFVGGENSYIFYGAERSEMDSIADATLPGEYSAVFAAGDINGDGADDVGTTILSGAPGRVDLYLGAVGAPFDPVADSTLTGVNPQDGFGGSVAALTTPNQFTTALAMQTSTCLVLAPTHETSAGSCSRR
jgi:FG-GAP repeat/FG-GAP-like repeat